MLEVYHLFDSCDSFFNGRINITQRNNIKQIYYNHDKKQFQIKDLNKLIAYLNYIINNRLFAAFPIIIDLKNAVFMDKLTYVLLECVCYYLLELGHIVIVNFKSRPNIILDGIKKSPLLLLKSKYNINTKLEYNKKFNKDYSSYHFRKILRQEDKEKDDSLVSSLMQDIDNFLKIYSVSYDYRVSISEVLAELVDNALEHSDGDCLIDLDITNDYKKVDADESENFYGINIVILNFSKILIGEKLQDKINTLSFTKNFSDRYSCVIEAKENHSQKYSDNYDENDFFVISAFQHRISSRKESNLGGTGLTKLLKSLEEKSDTYNCYLLSGNTVLWFIHEYLNYDKNDFIGFNKPNDYVGNIPSEDCLGRTSFFFPGTAYNLNFVLKHDINEENSNETTD